MSDWKNRVYLGSSERMDQIPDRSVTLVVTSPPYNVGKPYEGTVAPDELPLDEYLRLLDRVWIECYRVLRPGGRLAINLANLFRRPYLPLASLVTYRILQELPKVGCDYKMRGEIIWDKAASAGSSTAWGSFCRPSNPTLRDLHEYILVFSKGDFDLAPPAGGKPSISRASFVESTKSIWRMRAASPKATGHPAPFPWELPRRLIELYTYTEDAVLDPFAGSGSTCAAAKVLGRSWVGYDTSPAYVALATSTAAKAVNPWPSVEEQDAEYAAQRAANSTQKKSGRLRNKATPAYLTPEAGVP